MKRLIHILIVYLVFLLVACTKNDGNKLPGEPITGRTIEGNVILSNLTLIDGTGASAVPEISILIDNGIISEIGTELPKRDGYKVIDCSGKYAIPGLIEGHIHLTKSEDTNYGKGTLRKNFAKGVTTVRDMAGNGSALKTIKDWASDPTNPAGRVYYSSLVSGPVFIANDTRVATAAGTSIAGEVPWMPKLDSSTNIPKLVSEAKEFGVTGLKLYADITPELVMAVSSEAKEQGLKVWAHACIFSASPDDIVAAGVHSMSHAGLLTNIGLQRRNYMSPGGAPAYLDVNSSEVNAFLELMRSKGIVLDATLGITLRKNNSGRIRYVNNIMLKAIEKKVLIGAGTDNAGTLADEVKALTESGLSPLQGIQSATINNAIVLGIEKDYGTIEVGKIGDIVLLDANPLDDIGNLTKVSFVIKQGRTFSLTPTGLCNLQ